MINLPRFPNTFPTIFPHHRPFTLEIWGEEWWEFHGYQVNILKGRPLADTPRTWKQIGHVDGPASDYSTMKLYRSKDGGFRWSQYRDGCFYEFYGKLELLWHDEVFAHELTFAEMKKYEKLRSERYNKMRAFVPDWQEPRDEHKHPHRALRSWLAGVEQFQYPTLS